jgi:hypothetical protein
MEQRSIYVRAFRHPRKEWIIHKVKVKVKVTLRLTVSQSVRLGVGHPFGAHTRSESDLYISLTSFRDVPKGKPHFILGYQATSIVEFVYLDTPNPQ